jgi:hypothetical protein
MAADATPASIRSSYLVGGAITILGGIVELLIAIKPDGKSLATPDPAV